MSFACWTLPQYQYECGILCCTLPDCEGNYFFNFYCLFRPFYCCGAATALDNDETKLDVLRETRDARLASTVLGRSLIDLYYENTAEISAILLDDEELLEKAANVVNEIVEKALLLNNDEAVSVNQEFVRDFLELADLVNENASPGLKRAIKRVRREIKRKELFRKLGITIN